MLIDRTSKKESVVRMRQIETEELRQRQLCILDAVMDFCREHKIKCYLTCGTLLGAVRHQGYIPWDDDIDLLMFREDYEKLCDSFNKDRTDALRLFCLKNNPDFPFEFAKVGDTTTKIVEYVTNPYPQMGVNIDIFVADNVIDDEALLNKHNKKVQQVRWIQNFKSRIITKEMAWYKRIAFKMAKLLLAAYPFQKSVQEIDRLSRCFSKYADGKTVATVPLLHRKYCPFKKEWFEDEIQLVFENRNCPASKEYDIILKLLYGEYMKFPPIEQRITHHSFVAYACDENDE